MGDEYPRALIIRHAGCECPERLTNRTRQRDSAPEKRACRGSGANSTDGRETGCIRSRVDQAASTAVQTLVRSCRTKLDGSMVLFDQII